MTEAKPANQIRMGQLKATIWENEGAKGKFYSATIVRLYRTDAGWKETHSFSRSQIALLGELTKRVHDWMQDHETRQDREPGEE